MFHASTLSNIFAIYGAIIVVNTKQFHTVYCYWNIKTIKSIEAHMRLQNTRIYKTHSMKIILNITKNLARNLEIDKNMKMISYLSKNFYSVMS